MEKIFNIAVIGSSGMGRTHMKGIMNNPNARIYAACDLHEENFEKCKEIDPNIPVFTTDYRTLVNDPNVDAAIVATSDQTHKEITIAFLKAGKPVLCEKPMALTLEECEDMMRAEKESGSMLMIGQVCHYAPGFKKAKELVDEGRIGELFFVESEYAHDYAKRQGVDNWRVTPERNGFIGGGCHAVDLLRWIAGDPIEVCAYSNHKCLTTWPADDCTIGIYQFPNGVIGKVFASIGCKRKYTMRTVLYGTKGTIICDNKSPSIQLYEDVGPRPEDGKPSFHYAIDIPVEINSHNVTAEIEQFLEALVAGKAAPVSSREGASTVAVCCATVQAAHEGHPVKIRYPEV